MIGSLSGKVLRIDGVTALIDVNGVGYEVDMPVSSLGSLKVGESCFVYTQHVRNCGMAYDTIHPTLRDMIFTKQESYLIGYQIGGGFT